VQLIEWREDQRPRVLTQREQWREILNAMTAQDAVDERHLSPAT